MALTEVLPTRALFYLIWRTLMSNTLSIPTLFSNPNTLTMSSREIAELTGKRHDNVMRDIREIEDAVKQNSNLRSVIKSTTYRGSNGQEYPQYELDKDTTFTLLLGYDVAARFRVVKRWQELENQVLSIPTSFVEALRMAADLAEKNQTLALENHALSDENEELRQQIGDSKNYKQVKAIPFLDDYFHLKGPAWSQIGKYLTRLSSDLNLPPLEIHDSKYGTVKAYHQTVVQTFQDLLDNDDDILAKWRK